MGLKSDCYIYIHTRKFGERSGSIFYVGKGCGNRLNQITGRNKYWKNTVSKYGFDAQILCSGLSDDEAFQIERDIIGSLQEFLCNMDPGGKGFKSGYLHPFYKTKNHPMRGREFSSSHREKIGENSRLRISVKGNPMKGVTFDQNKRKEKKYQKKQNWLCQNPRSGKDFY